MKVTDKRSDGQTAGSTEPKAAAPLQVRTDRWPISDTFRSTPSEQRNLPAITSDVRLSPVEGQSTPTQSNGQIGKRILALRDKGAVSESDLVSNYAPTANNSIDLLVDGSQVFPNLLNAIDAARDHVHASFYMLEDDAEGRAFVDRLKAARARGVEVRLMVDGIGSRLWAPWADTAKLLQELQSAGVEVIRNHVVDVTRDSEVLNRPDHRKMVVIDGRVGFTGGINITNDYRNTFHDLMVRAEGDAVKQLQAEWMAAWLHLDGKIPAPSSLFCSRYFPEYTAESNPGTTSIVAVQHIPGENRAILRNYLERINTATSSIDVETPYCTNPEILSALMSAARRGVAVRMILPGQSDHVMSQLASRNQYPEMIRAGIKVYEYSGFNHGKIMVIDGKHTIVGSSNLDDISLRHVSELNLNVDSEAFAGEVRRRLFDVDVAKSKLMKAEDVTQLDMLMGRFWQFFVRAL